MAGQVDAVVDAVTTLSVIRFHQDHAVSCAECFGAIQPAGSCKDGTAPHDAMSHMQQGLVRSQHIKLAACNGPSSKGPAPTSKLLFLSIEQS